MGAKTSKRSVDITTTPKKGDGDNVPGEGEGKVEKINDLEAKVTTNGGIHTEIEYADKEETEKDQAETIKDNGVSENEGDKTPEAAIVDTTNEIAEIATKEKSPTPEKSEETPESNKKNKEKSKKKKWSFRSISFSKKEKSKPDKDAEKTDEVKENVEEEEKVTTPTPDEPKVDGEKQPEVTTPAPITNSDVIPEEPAKTEECKLAQPEPKSEPEPVVEPPKPKVECKPTEVIAPTNTEVSESKPVEGETKLVEVEQKPTEVAEPKPVVEPVIAEESKEVRSEEVPPPLPTSNPPSPVTVFAESTMAKVPVVETVPEPVSDPIVCEKTVEHSTPVVTESSTVKETEPVAQSSPVVEQKLVEVEQEAPPSPVTEQILNADSLPDISTESLPSLPEPLSESLPEPMSLPPVECVPEPITNDTTEPEPIPNIPLESEAVLTNGDASGLPSPIHNGTSDDTDVTPPAIATDRPIKQVIPATETERQEIDDKPDNTEQTPVKVEE